MSVGDDVRRLVWERAGGVCEYCRLSQSAVPRTPHQIEHVRPITHGGGDGPANLALACVRCNRCEGPNLSGIDPLTDTVAVLFDPRTMRWDDHFSIDDLEVVGLTEVGRATVACLRMNDEGQLAKRAVYLWPS